MKRAQETYGPRGFSVVGFNTDTTAEVMNAFIRENGYDWPENHLGERRFEAARERYWVTGYPTNFLVDREGRILTRSIRLGNAAADQEIERALGR